MTSPLYSKLANVSELELPPLEAFQDEIIIICQGRQDDNTHQIQLYRVSNIAIPLNYFFCGLVQGLIYPLLNVYSLDLGATEAQQQTIMTLKELPSCFKIVYGIWSDNVPIWGYRRKPYMFLGWLVAILSLLPLLFMSDLTLQLEKMDSSLDGNSTVSKDTADSSFVTTVPPNAPTMPLLSISFFLWACGVWFTDVMGDSLVAEKAKFEDPASRGELQVICYVVRGVGMAMMAPLSTWIYHTPSGPFWIVLGATLAPLFHMPWIYMLQECRDIKIMTTCEQLKEIWKTVCSRSVWQPMGFIYLHLLFFVSNSAWKEFLKSWIGFSPGQLNAIMILSAGLAVLGAALYKFIAYKWNWRLLFGLGIGINGIFSLGQVLLIKGWTMGLSPFWFSLGDEAVVDFLLGTQYLPTCVMMVNLVPSGIEGASYALFTTTWNAASSLSDSVSTMLLGIWDVQKERLVNGELNGLIKLTILTSILQTIPIFFIWMLPRGVAELQRQRIETVELEGSDKISSRFGGAVYLAAVLLSVVWSIFVAFMNIFRPGWMGES